MKKYIAGCAVLLLLLACSSSPEIDTDISKSQKNESPKNFEVIIMKLISPVFVPGGPIPPKYTCDGADISPPLKITAVPATAKSLVLIMDDPDAVKPAGKVWDHWIVFNIPPTTSEVPENTEPQGVQGKNSFGSRGYGGPCPPDARHRYSFKLYALDTLLNLKEGVGKKDVETAMAGHVVAQVELMGAYERK